MVMMTVVMTVFLFLFYFCSAIVVQDPHTKQYPSYVLASTDFTKFPSRRTASNPQRKAVMSKCDIQYYPRNSSNCRFKGFRSRPRADNEHHTAFDMFFWGGFNGIVMEMGAVEGTFRSGSNTEIFSAYYGWKRILIEGNPLTRDVLSSQPNSLAANVAICNKASQVHYYVQKALFGGGIIEFMSEKQVKRFFPRLYAETVPLGNMSSLNFSKSKEYDRHIKVVECLPMQTLLEIAGVSHIDFFILDVEGGELSVLRSIDWDKTRISVLAIETTSMFGLRPAQHRIDVLGYMKSIGYEHVLQKGRNDWFKHPEFTPVQSKPNEVLTSNTWRVQKK